MVKLWLCVFSCLYLGFSSDAATLTLRCYNALDRILDFVEDNVNDMNLDGIFGLVQGEGHLLASRKTGKHKGMLNPLIIKCESIRRKYNQLPLNFSSNYKLMYEYIVKPKVWGPDIEFTSGTLNQSLQVDTGTYNVSNRRSFYNYVSRDSTFSESISDGCYVELMTPYDHEMVRICIPSETCIRYQLNVPEKYDSAHVGYGATHKLLYVQMAKALNCKMDKKCFDDFTNKICSYVLWELKNNMKIGPIPAMIDLLIEQILLCGAEGYTEFLNLDYLEYILNYQKTESCFSVKNRLSKRESNKMLNDCNSHTTGLAISAYSLFLRYLLK